MGYPVPGVLWEGDKPIGWLEDHWAWQNGCGKPEFHPRGAHMLVCLRGRVQRGWSKGCWISSNHLAVNPSLSFANTSAPLTPRHIAALDLRWLWLGQRLDHGTQSDSILGQLGWYPSGCLFRKFLRNNSDPWQQLHNHSSPAETCWVLMGPAHPAKQLHNRAGGAEARVRDQLWWTKETWTQGCVWEEPLGPALELRTFRGLTSLLQGNAGNTHTPTLQGNIASLGPTLWASTPATWDQTHW